MSAMSDERMPRGRRDRAPHDGGEAEAPAAGPASEAAGCGSPRLDAAVRALREPVPVRGEWRRALLHELAGAPSPRRSRWASTPWTVTPARAVAAALLCAALGAAGTYTAMRQAGASAAAPSHASTLAVRAVGAEVTPVSSAEGETVVRFTVAAAGASRVSVVGDFNGWDPAATPLRRAGADGAWTVTVPLPPGRHVYAFVVDGGLTTDPSAPHAPDDDFGAPNSVVLVGGPRT